MPRIKWLVLATASSIILFATVELGSAAPRVTLGQCIAKYNQCWWGCYVNSPLPPPYATPATKNCANRCDANHAACVDIAMSFSRSGSAARKRSKPSR